MNVSSERPYREFCWPVEDAKIGLSKVVGSEEVLKRPYEEREKITHLDKGEQDERAVPRGLARSAERLKVRDLLRLETLCARQTVRPRTVVDGG